MSNSFFATQNNFKFRKLQVEDNAANFSRNLYEEVVRKNQQIIKQILSKINELCNKHQDLESIMKGYNEKLAKITNTNEQIHHEFRTSTLEYQRKQQNILNDLSGFKNILKIPNSNQNHQQYLSSDFFKEQSLLINNRGRSRDRNRHKTNYQIQQKEAFGNSQQQKVKIQYPNSVKQLSQVNFIIPKEQAQFIKGPASGITEFEILQETKRYKQKEEKQNQLIQQLKQSLQYGLTKLKDQFQKKSNQSNDLILKQIDNQIQLKLQKISKSLVNESDINRIDFEGLHNYIQSKVKSELQDKVSKVYFEQSLQNLKQAWQLEVDEIYLKIGKGLTKQDIFTIEEKVSDLASQLEGYANLNSIKIKNISYNSTCKSTPYRPTVPERSSVQSQSEYNPYTQLAQLTNVKKNQLSYSNSLSSLYRYEQSKQKKKQPCTPNQGYQIGIDRLKWKQKVTNILGLASKKITRRIRRQ